MYIINLFSTPVRDLSGEGLEKVFFNYQAILFSLYSFGITKKTVELETFSRVNDVSICEHFNISPEYQKSETANTFSSPDLIPTNTKLPCELGRKK